MHRRIWILNLGVIALLVFGILKFRQDWRAFGPLHDVQAIRSAPTLLPSLPVAPKAGNAANASWPDIPARDPFSFDRNDIAIVIAEPVAAAAPKPLGPRPLLFGTLILGKTERIALVASGATANRNSRPLKIGDSIDGWTLTDINDKKIQIESTGISQWVTVDDSAALVPRDYSRTLANTSSAAQTIPSSTAMAPAAPAPVQPGAPPSPANPAVPGQKHTHIEVTPFGNRVVEDPPQQ